MTTTMTPKISALCVAATTLGVILTVIFLFPGLLLAALLVVTVFLAVFPAVAACAIKFSHILRTFPRFIYSVLLSSSRPRRHVRLVEEFRSVPFSTNEASRSRAMQFLQAVSGSCDYTLYVHQMSQDDQEAGLLGDRTYFWAKDLDAEVRSDPLPPNPLHVWVDVDYYVQPEALLQCDAPVALYTLTPSHAAHSDNHFSYCFDNNSNVIVRYKRGQSFKHPLWDYSETFAVNYTFLGIPVIRANFRTYRKPVGPHHSLLLIVPQSREYYPLSLFHWLTGDDLQPFVGVKSGYAALRQFSSHGVTVSIARAEADTDVTLTAEQYDSLTSVIATLSSGTPMSAGLVRSYIPDLTHGQSAIVADYFKHEHPIPKHVTPGSNPTMTYTFDNKPSAYPMKGKMMDIATPLIPGMAYDPAVCAANDEACVRERVELIRSTVEATPRILHYIDEFCKLMVPRPHMVRPRDVEHVYDLQDRPSQRRILDEAAATGDGRNMNVASSFQKGEIYSEPKAPRNISQVPGVPKLWYSTIMYAFVEEILKHQVWYAFGRAPCDVSKRVASICSRAQTHVIATDFSKFDGTIGPVLRRLEVQLLRRTFTPDCIESVLKWHSTQYGCIGYTKFGIQYDTGYSRESGSPETSAFNTTANAFVSYCASRMSGLKPTDAYAALGIYGGDDGLCADVIPGKLEAAAKELGLNLKAQTVLRGQRWVTFLARYYGPNVWDGDWNSCCDLKRQLGKLHTTTEPCNDPLGKLIQKIAAFSYTDAQSPVFQHLVQTAVRVMGSQQSLQDTCDKTDLPFLLQQAPDLSGQYKNEYADWMDELLYEQVPGACVGPLIEYLREVSGRTASKFLTMPPLCDAVEIKIPAAGSVEGVLACALTESPPAPKPRPARLGKIAPVTGDRGMWADHPKQPQPQAFRPTKELRITRTFKRDLPAAATSVPLTAVPPTMTAKTPLSTPVTIPQSCPIDIPTRFLAEPTANPEPKSTPPPMQVLPGEELVGRLLRLRKGPSAV